MSRSLRATRSMWQPDYATRKALASGRRKMRQLRDAKRFGDVILAAGPL